MTDLVVVSLERWDEVWRRNQYLVAGLLEADPDLRVLFVEPSDDPLHAVRSRRKPAFGQGLRRHPTTARLWTYRAVKWLPRRIDRAIDDRFAHGVQRAARRLGMIDPLLWINDPAAVAVVRSTGWCTLYDITDDWAAADRPPSERERIVAGERELLATAVEVTACSPEIIRRKNAQRGDITLIRNAVDVRAYATPAPRPGDLPRGPVALYAGTVHPDRFDVALCEASARTLGDRGAVVLVGPNLLDAADTDRLADAGVLILGARPREAIPGYLQHADLLLVPHVVTPFTDSLDPIKLYEYQAVSRRVVSTPVAGFRDSPDPWTTVASGPTFVAEVANRLGGSATLPAHDGHHLPDWSDRVTAVRHVLSRMVS